MENVLRIRRYTQAPPPCCYCRYPKNSIIQEKCFYLVYKGTPFLFSLLDSEQDETYLSEGIVLNFKELFFSFFLSFDVRPIYLADYCDIDLAREELRMQSGADLLHEEKNLKILIEKSDLLLEGCDLIDINASHLKYMNHPLTQDIVFTRVAFALLKAEMLALTSNLFYEDACFNIYVALEGLVQLLHNKYYPNQEFKFENIRLLFRDLLDDNDCFFNWLKEEVREDRHIIVHPQVAKDIEITFPTSSGEDYAENHQYAFALTEFLLDEDVDKLNIGL